MNLHLIPQPEVLELPFDQGWLAWDSATRELDAQPIERFSLVPTDREVLRSKLSERSAFRREVRA